MDDTDLQNIVDDLTYLAVEHDDRMVLNILVGSHPADIANIVKALPSEEAKYVFGLLDVDTASDVIIELDDVTRERLVSEMKEERLTELVDEMDSDDATDIVADLPDHLAEKVLDSIDIEDSHEVQELLLYDEDTAGGLMAMEFVSVSEDAAVDDAIREIRIKADEVDDVYNVYAVDEDGLLTGFIPLKKLILAKSEQRVKNVMVREVTSVPTNLDQEEVAHIFRKYDLVSLPVVDDIGKLVGRITIDDIVDVIEEEASEDMQRMAGITDEEEIRETSVMKISLGRLPWLLVGFGGQLVAAVVMKQFEASLREIFVATFFIPLMMAMGGNAGIQAATIVVRGMALGELNPGETFKRLRREMQVSLFNGSVCGVLLFAVVAIIDKPPFGVVLALSMIGVILNASFIGASVPLVLRRAGVDPAIATGPLITTFNDIIGLSIYLGLVTVSMQLLL